MTDPIADMLTRIRNANKEMHSTVTIPASNKKINIIKILKTEGYIQDFSVKNIDDAKKKIVIKLKYKENKRVISGIKRISKPSLRVYVGSDEIPKVYNGLGTVIMTTSKGVLTDRQARKEKVGGEIIAYIW